MKLVLIRRYATGASKGTPGDAKYITEILGATKIRNVFFGGGSLNLVSLFSGK